MNDPAHHDEDEDQGDVFIDENDVVQEITVDDEGESISPSFFLSIFVCVCVFFFNFFVSLAVYADLPDVEGEDDDAEDFGIALIRPVFFFSSF